ncbi:MAG: hypothetical protein U1C56_02225, partial [Candidatus Curtissbacteria bacterium]|nr:hypothetical protein [Candidatus Curtissbacteria bacterium]
LYLTIVAPTEGSSFPVGTPIRIVWESNVPKQKIEIQWCGKSIGCRKEDWHYVLMLRNGDNGGEFVWSPPQSLRGDVSIFVGMLVPQRFQEEFGSVWVLEARTKIQIQ